MLSFELKLNAEFDFFSNYYLECLKFRQISGIRLFQLQIAVVLTTRMRLAAFQIEGEAQVWWNWAKT